MCDPKLLDQRVVSHRGACRRVKRWWQGIHPEKGTIIHGYTGWETEEERDCVQASHTFMVSGDCKQACI